MGSLMIGRVRRIAILLLLTVATASLLPALGAREPQAALPTELPEAGTFAVPVVLYLSWPEKPDDQLQLVRDGAAALLASRQPDAQVLLHPGEPPEDRRQATVDRDAVAWIEIVVAEDGLLADIRAAAFTTVTVEPVFEVEYRELVGSSLLVPTRLWRATADAFAEAWPELVDLAFSDFRTALLTVEAVAGARVTGIGGEARIVPDSGTISVPVPVPQSLLLHARAPRHYPLEQPVFVLETDRVVSLSLPQRSPWVFDFGLSGFSYPAIDVARHVAGDYLFGKIGLTSYVLGLTALADSDDFDDERERVFSSEPLTVFSGQIGTYLASPHGALRPYLASGFSWRLIHAREFFGSDPIAPWGVVTTFGIETRPTHPWRVFFQWEPTLYRTRFPEAAEELLPGGTRIWGRRTSVAGIGVDPGDSGSPSWVLAGGLFRIGVRFQRALVPIDDQLATSR
ncbi:MAG: hypothetical protein EA403_15965 [Spirochaetaceae bacterium]|nr:MAG: hypothetical protein EA403_15965 [Spirochaetaceae bacterium]